MKFFECKYNCEEVDQFSLVGSTEGEGLISIRLNQEKEKNKTNDIYIYKEINLLKENKRIDFLIYSESFGLIILEIKDWSEDFIEDKYVSLLSSKDGKYSEILFEVKKYGIQNPFRQAWLYKSAVRKQLFIGKEIPIKYLLIFPNLDFRGILSSLNLDHDKIDDCCEKVIDKNQIEKFSLEYLVERACLSEVKFKKIIPIEEMHYRFFQINLETRDFQLDRIQYNIAINFENVSEKHLILKGVPGSGKSLILKERLKINYLLNKNKYIILFTSTYPLQKYYTHDFSWNKYIENNIFIMVIEDITLSETDLIWKKGKKKLELCKIKEILVDEIQDFKQKDYDNLIIL